MATITELTDEQRTYLRELPLYPWAVWISRLWMGAFAFVFGLAVTGRGGSLAGAGFLLLFPLVLINSVAKRLVLNQMARVLRVRRFTDQARLGSAVSRVIYRDALLGDQTRK